MDIEKIKEKAQEQIEQEFEEFCVKEAKYRLEEITSVEKRLAILKAQFDTDMKEENLRSRFTKTADGRRGY